MSAAGGRGSRSVALLRDARLKQETLSVRCRRACWAQVGRYGARLRGCSGHGSVSASACRRCPMCGAGDVLAPLAVTVRSHGRFLLFGSTVVSACRPSSQVAGR